PASISSPRSSRWKRRRIALMKLWSWQQPPAKKWMPIARSSAEEAGNHAIPHQVPAADSFADPALRCASDFGKIVAAGMAPLCTLSHSLCPHRLGYLVEGRAEHPPRPGVR